MTLVGWNTGGGAAAYLVSPIMTLPASGIAFRVETENVIDLDESLITSMITPSKLFTPSSYKYGLGVMVYDKKYYALGHHGGGFQSAMFWHPEYEFGILLMFNVPFGEWEKIPRLQAKTLVLFWHGALSQVQSYDI